MKIVKIKGGLGNQMFQYVFAKVIEEISGDEVKLDYSSYIISEKYRIRKPWIMKFSLSLNGATIEELNKMKKLKYEGNMRHFFYRIGIFIEKTINKKYFFEYNRAYINPETIISKSFFDGYWQSYKYVDKVLEKILNEFIPNYKISNNSQSWIDKINRENAVFVGVRKGDYLKEHSHYGSFGSAYYKKAMNYIFDRVENPIFYIFSNDIEWCKNNIDFSKYNIIYREGDMQSNDFEELLLMSSCKHAIIVNSTYHWWGAQLIKNPEKIVCCPKQWFLDNKPIDIIRPEWVSM